MKRQKTQKEIKHWACIDCGKDCKINPIDYYMVTFELWGKYGVGGDMLCMDCIENRIGHKLTKEDILDCPLNTDINLYTQKILNN